MARQEKAGRGFGRLAGGAWGEGGGPAPTGPTLGDTPVNELQLNWLARREQQAKETGAASGSGTVTGKHRKH